MPDMRERRRHPRYEIRGLTGQLRSDESARILDISVNGMAVETDAWLHVGQSYLVRLVVEGEQLDLRGQVSWCRLVGTHAAEGGEHRPRYRAGLEFGDTLTEKAHQVLEFARRTGLAIFPDRVFGRFLPNDGASPDVILSEPIEIRRASLGGLLLRARSHYDVGDRFGLQVDVDGDTLEVTVEVRSVTPCDGDGSEGPAPMDLGVAFVDMTLENRALVERLLTKHAQA